MNPCVFEPPVRGRSFVVCKVSFSVNFLKFLFFFVKKILSLKCKAIASDLVIGLLYTIGGF